MTVTNEVISMTVDNQVVAMNVQDEVTLNVNPEVVYQSPDTLATLASDGAQYDIAMVNYVSGNLKYTHVSPAEYKTVLGISEDNLQKKVLLYKADGTVLGFDTLPLAKAALSDNETIYLRTAGIYNLGSDSFIVDVDNINLMCNLGVRITSSNSTGTIIVNSGKTLNISGLPVILNTAAGGNDKRIVNSGTVTGFYWEYEAKLTQNGEEDVAPVATLTKNTLGITPAWAYSVPGAYTTVFISGTRYEYTYSNCMGAIGKAAAEPRIPVILPNGASITLRLYDFSGTMVDGILVGTELILNVKVYP